MAKSSIITADVKRLFFDRKYVMRIVDKAHRRNLVRVGGLVRTTARRLIRPARRMKVSEMLPKQRAAYKAQKKKAKKEGKPAPRRPMASSLPGEPPRSPTKERLLRNSIFFHLDPATTSVVIGPTKKSSNAPEVLEKGGNVRVVDAFDKNGKRVVRTARIKPRPYMGPANERVMATDKVPSMWRNSVR